MPARAASPARAKPEGGLLVCATPVGNLGDVTLRVLSALREADVVLCEDTRQTRKLLDRYGIKTSLVSFHEHNERARVPAVLGWLRAGRTVVLVSDAGSPLMADPGFPLVRACLAEGLPVTVLPGPVAFVPALILSGLPPVPFAFLGFLPRRGGGRRRLLEIMAVGDLTVAFYESPRRLETTLAELEAVVGAERRVAVARELTKVHEEVVRGTVAEVRARLGSAPVRGECVLVVGPKEGNRPGRGDDPAGP